MLRITEPFSPLPEFGHWVQQSVITLIAMVDNQIFPLGTGFMVQRDGLMMTAAHVVKELDLQRRGRLAAFAKSQEAINFFALYLTNEKHKGESNALKGGLWPIDKIWWCESLDIAFCWLRRGLRDGEPIYFRTARLSLRLPEVGERILGFGYWGMNGTITGEIVQGKHTIEYAQQTAFTQGKVTEVFPTQRDSGMLSFPCFRTDARFEPGMSGGPIFNEEGSVCGVICSSMPLIEDDPKYISYASLLWAAMGIQIQVCMQQGGPLEDVLIYDLVKTQRLLIDDDISKIRVVTLPDGKRTVAIKAEPKSPSSGEAKQDSGRWTWISRRSSHSATPHTNDDAK